MIYKIAYATTAMTTSFICIYTYIVSAFLSKQQPLLGVVFTVTLAVMKCSEPVIGEIFGHNRLRS